MERPPILDFHITTPESYLQQGRRITEIGQDIFTTVKKEKNPLLMELALILMVIRYAPELIARVMTVSTKVFVLVYLVAIMVDPSGVIDQTHFEEQPIHSWLPIDASEMSTATRVGAIVTLLYFYRRDRMKERPLPNSVLLTYLQFYSFKVREKLRNLSKKKES